MIDIFWVIYGVFALVLIMAAIYFSAQDAYEKYQWMKRKQKCLSCGGNTSKPLTECIYCGATFATDDGQQ